MAEADAEIEILRKELDRFAAFSASQGVLVSESTEEETMVLGFPREDIAKVKWASATLSGGVNGLDFDIDYERDENEEGELIVPHWRKPNVEGGVAGEIEQMTCEARLKMLSDYIKQRLNIMTPTELRGIFGSIHTAMKARLDDLAADAAE